MNEKIIASIVTYNPDIKRLKENINAISDQVDRVVLVDNGSNNKNEIEELLNELQVGCFCIYNNTNGGIAKALNQAFLWAEKENYDWVLTLDQDTVCAENLVYGLIKHVNREKIAIIAPKYIDRNYEDVTDNDHGWEFVERCITSASLTNVKAWRDVDGFYEELFIDYVDYDFCAKLRRKGYKIIRDSDVAILHEIGHSKKICIGKHSYVLYNHSPIRDYYIVRNRLYYCSEYGDVWDVESEKKAMILRCFMIAFFEKNRIRKIKAMLSGWRDSAKLIKTDKSKKVTE